MAIQINSMVEGKGGALACTHFDAFRFFTPEAKPLNPVQLERTGQRSNDQPGCVHANMDLFKWALRLWPLLPSEKLADALELAVSCRMLVRLRLKRRARHFPCDLFPHRVDAIDSPRVCAADRQNPREYHRLLSVCLQHEPCVSPDRCATRLTPQNPPTGVYVLLLASTSPNQTTRI